MQTELLIIRAEIAMYAALGMSQINYFGGSKFGAVAWLCVAAAAWFLTRHIRHREESQEQRRKLAMLREFESAAHWRAQK